MWKWDKLVNVKYIYWGEFSRIFSCQWESKIINSGFSEFFVSFFQYEEAASKDDLMGIEDTASRGGGLFHKATLKNKATVFTIGNRGEVLTSQLEAPITVPHAAQKTTAKVPPSWILTFLMKLWWKVQLKESCPVKGWKQKWHQVVRSTYLSHTAKRSREEWSQSFFLKNFPNCLFLFFLISTRLELTDTIVLTLWLVIIAAGIYFQFPYEALFRSVQYALLDNACREYLFISEFYMVKPPHSIQVFNRIWDKTLTYLHVS